MNVAARTMQLIRYSICYEPKDKNVLHDSNYSRPLATFEDLDPLLVPFVTETTYSSQHINFQHKDNFFSFNFHKCIPHSFAFSHTIEINDVFREKQLDLKNQVEPHLKDLNANKFNLFVYWPLNVQSLQIFYIVIIGTKVI